MLPALVEELSVPSKTIVSPTPSAILSKNRLTLSAKVNVELIVIEFCDATAVTVIPLDRAIPLPEIVIPTTIVPEFPSNVIVVLEDVSPLTTAVASVPPPSNTS